MTKKLLPVIVFLCGFSFSARSETILNVEKVRELALNYNRQLQSAQKELYRSSGEIISARAGALPQISLDGRYTRNIEAPALFFEGEKIPIGLNNDFNLSLSLTQPLYVGGKVGAALDIAEIYKTYSQEKIEEIERNIVFGAESMFYRAILVKSQCEVLASARDQLDYNLQVVEKLHSQGMVSDFELLRAQVERKNLDPQLTLAESQLSITRKELKSYLGLPLGEEISFDVDLSDTTINNLPEKNILIENALATRPEMKQAVLKKEGYRKAVKIARGNWLYPNLYFNTTYQVNASSDDFNLNSRNTSKSWAASLILNIPIFDGARTIGEIRKVKTDFYQAQFAEEQLKDDIELEVEQALDGLIHAKKALELQKETINQAEEGMRIANLRYQTGIGTQLEVLSAQTALTDARTNLAGAIYNFRLAKSALKKATGMEIN